MSSRPPVGVLQNPGHWCLTTSGCITKCSPCGFTINCRPIIMDYQTSYYPRSTTDVWKGYFYKHQVDFFGSRRCLRRPGFDSYFAPIIKFIRPDYYQCFLSNRDIMVFFGQLTVFLSLDLFCCYGCRACFFGTSQHITCSQSVFASVVPHQDQPIFPCQL